MASLYRAMGKNKDAIDYYERALKVNKKAGNVYRVLKDFKNLSEIYKSLGDKEKSKKYKELAQNITKKINKSFN